MIIIFAVYVRKFRSLFGNSLIGFSVPHCKAGERSGDKATV